MRSDKLIKATPESFTLQSSYPFLDELKKRTDQLFQRILDEDGITASGIREGCDRWSGVILESAIMSLILDGKISARKNVNGEITYHVVSQQDTHSTTDE